MLRKPTKSGTKPQARGWPGSSPGSKPLHPVYDDDDENEPQRPVPPPAVPVPISPPVAFVCDDVPALGLGLPSRWHAFQHGLLTLTDLRYVEALRKHGWYGSKIFEMTEDERVRTVAIPDRWAKERWDALQAVQAHAKTARRRSHLMGPRGPLGPTEGLASFPVRRERRSW